MQQRVRENENFTICLTLCCILVTIVTKYSMAKITNLKLEGIIKKIPMSAASMSR